MVNSKRSQQQRQCLPGLQAGERQAKWRSRESWGSQRHWGWEPLTWDGRRRDCAGRGQNERRVEGPGQMQRRTNIPVMNKGSSKSKEEVKIPSTQFYENTLNFVRDSSQIQSLKSRSICLFKFLFRVTPIISFIITSSSLLLFTETPHDHFNCKKEN